MERQLAPIRRMRCEEITEKQKVKAKRRKQKFCNRKFLCVGEAQSVCGETVKLTNAEAIEILAKP